MDLKVVLLVAVCFCVVPVQVGGWKYIYYQYFSLLTKYRHLYGELQELKDLLASLTKGYNYTSIPMMKESRTDYFFHKFVK